MARTRESLPGDLLSTGLIVVFKITNIFYGVLLKACKDIGLAVNIEKSKYMEIGRHRGIIANAHVKIGSNSYEKVETFK